MSVNKPFFSVVMPLYNKEKHVSRAIQSVLDQTFADFELIIVNDASTDKSLEIVEKFEDSRIRIFQRSEPGPGGYAARNLGIEKAHTDWIAFIDADDEWFPNHLEAYRKLIEEYPSAGMLCCGYKVQNGSCSKVNPYFEKNREFGNHQIPPRLFLENYAKNSFIQFTSVACIKKNLLKSFGGFPAGKIKKGGDLYTWFQCALRSKQNAWSAHLGAIYHTDSDNMVTKTTYPSPDAQRQLTQSLIEFASKDCKKALKIIHNHTIIRFYKQRIISSEKKFFVPKYLFFFADPLKYIFWLLFDISFGLLPSQQLAKLARLYTLRPRTLRFSKRRK